MPPPPPPLPSPSSSGDEATSSSPEPEAGPAPPPYTSPHTSGGRVRREPKPGLGDEYAELSLPPARTLPEWTGMSFRP
ncbi:uncharacterized protein TrAtP1_001808 [Trichoderma atroviride]|uniref:uncharacterized protein n=1 Tax=Hypocrea atroviridis TaxID=63577 RepID=UPI00332BE78B|nr:hypothetical protein TrAtP1_001808 [Trichoderma atroviride]